MSNILIKANDHYESRDGRYKVTHMTGYKSVNCGNLSRKYKRDEWWLKDRETGKTTVFTKLKFAEHYILTGEYRAY